MAFDINQHRSRAGRMKDFFLEEDHLKEIDKHEDIKEDKDSFLLLVEEYDQMAPVLDEQNPVPFSEKKDEEKLYVSELLSKWGIRCHKQARKLGKYSVETILNKAPFVIYDMPDESAIILMNAMRKALNENLNNFTKQGLTATVIASIDDAIKAFVDDVNSPQNAIKGHKATNEELKTKMGEIDNVLADLVALLAAEWKGTHDNWVIEMKARYVLLHFGHHYTGFEGTALDATDKPLTEYTVEIGAKKAVVDADGHDKILSAKAGAHEAQLKDTKGNVVQSQTIKLVKGNTITINWKL